MEKKFPINELAVTLILVFKFLLQFLLIIYLRSGLYWRLRKNIIRRIIVVNKNKIQRASDTIFKFEGLYNIMQFYLLHEKLFFDCRLFYCIKLHCLFI